MYQGKHVKRTKYSKSRANRRKATVLLTTLVLLLTCLVGTTVAYLIMKTNQVTNTFQPARVTCEVNETFDGATKTDVTIANTSNIEAYIRAAIVVTWKDAENGNVYGRKPVAGTDYIIDQNTADYIIELNTVDWIEGDDGYYYYKNPVAPGNSTSALIDRCSPVASNTPAGYGLNVEILGSAIQSVPASVVEQSWKVVKVNTDGTLAEK